jgi:hypothetical protein
MEMAGVSRSVGMSFTGHSTESIYTRYAIVDSQAQRHGAQKIPGLDRHNTVTNAPMRMEAPEAM